MLLILKKQFSTWLLPDIFRYDSPKKCPTILYAVNLWLKLGLAGRRMLANYASTEFTVDVLFCFTPGDAEKSAIIQI